MLHATHFKILFVLRTTYHYRLRLRSYYRLTTYHILYYYYMLFTTYC